MSLNPLTALVIAKSPRLAFGRAAVHPHHGMGLALCRRIIESYEGGIWVEDNPGGGSRFRFTLPATSP